ncbi:MAG TPA: hypothetical protein VK897_22350 [Anaerolineales bacterium]|nr:hypothetical protein [Anaerolineales bacterium]
MTRDSLIDEMESDPTDVRARFREIRDALNKAQSREDLTEIYKRSVYMILMTHSSPLDEKTDRGLKRRQATAEREFARTVRVINKQAKKIGLEPDYDDNWKNLATNAYETEGENLLEAQRTVGIVREQEGQKDT